MRIQGKLLVAVVLVGMQAPTSVQSAEVCIPINATASESFDLMDPGGELVLVRGEITGGGILHGTTVAFWTLTGFDPDTGTLTFEGVMAIDTGNGTLYLSSAIVVDATTREYRSTSYVTGGTGRFDGATGELVFQGFFAPNGTFTDEEISGEICVQVP